MIRQTHVSQLVFGDTVLTDLLPWKDVASCKKTVRQRLGLEPVKLPYDSLADKLYRLFTPKGDVDSLRAEATRDFAEKSCTAGPLSQAFHTDLPRTFVRAERVRFECCLDEKTEQPSFEQLFPGAHWIISLSHVGFDSALHEAVLSISFVCGGLCGSSYRYLLRKESGRWRIVNKLLVGIS